MYVLQNVHGQFVGFHFFTLLLKTWKDEAFFSWSGSRGQILVPKFDTVSVQTMSVSCFLKLGGYQSFKSDSHLQKNIFICLNESSLKMMKLFSF